MRVFLYAFVYMYIHPIYFSALRRHFEVQTKMAGLSSHDDLH